MDDKTLELLEFDAVRRLLAGYASSSLGKELAGRIRPTTSARRIAVWQQTTTQLAAALVTEGPVPLGGVHDIRATVRRAAPEGAVLEGHELGPIAETLQASGRVRHWLYAAPESATQLVALADHVHDYSPIGSGVADVLGPEGEVLDHASTDLRSLRYRVGELRDRIAREMRRMANSSSLREALQYPRHTLHGDRFVLPVKQSHRAWVSGVVHRTSDSGSTLFVEPTAVCEMSNRLVALIDDERREVRRILRDLTGQVGAEADGILETVRTLAIVDLANAKARFSRDYEMAEPEINDQGRIRLTAARHPLLTAIQRETDGRRPVVPIDVNVGETFHTLVVTGPNTGGKTVALKTVGLLCVMAQSGLHIPAARGATVPIFRGIWADIGDEQGIIQNLSTFSSHIKRIITILDQVDRRSLVILDELGAGTDPAEGAALGRAILEELDRRGTRTLASTHIGELKSYAYECPRAANACVEFDVETLRPTYRFIIGVPGSSNALRIARYLGLDAHVVDRAESHQAAPDKALAEQIEAVQRTQQQVEATRQEAVNLKHETDELRAAFERNRSEFQRRMEYQDRLEEARENLEPGMPVRVPKMDASGPVVRVNRPRREVVVRLPLADVTVSFGQTVPILDDAPDGEHDGP